MILGYFIFMNKSEYGLRLFFCPHIPSSIQPLDARDATTNKSVWVIFFFLRPIPIPGIEDLVNIGGSLTAKSLSKIEYSQQFLWMSII